MLNQSNPVDLYVLAFSDSENSLSLYPAVQDVEPEKCLRTEQSFSVSCPLVTLVAGCLVQTGIV